MCIGAREELEACALDGLAGNVGSISPPYPITLGIEGRRLAKIPLQATAFVWAYPLVRFRSTAREVGIRFMG